MSERGWTGDFCGMCGTKRCCGTPDYWPKPKADTAPSVPQSPDGTERDGSLIRLEYHDNGTLRRVVIGDTITTTYSGTMNDLRWIVGAVNADHKARIDAERAALKRELAEQEAANGRVYAEIRK